MTKRRSGVRFVGNSPELDEEFRKMLEIVRRGTAGPSRETHTCTAPPAIPEVDENTGDQAVQDESGPPTRLPDTPTRKPREEPG